MSRTGAHAELYNLPTIWLRCSFRGLVSASWLTLTEVSVGAGWGEGYTAHPADRATGLWNDLKLSWYCFIFHQLKMATLGAEGTFSETRIYACLGLLRRAAGNGFLGQTGVRHERQGRLFVGSDMWLSGLCLYAFEQKVASFNPILG